jgi:hypothetical protein
MVLSTGVAAVPDEIGWDGIGNSKSTTGIQ